MLEVTYERVCYDHLGPPTKNIFSHSDCGSGRKLFVICISVLKIDHQCWLYYQKFKIDLLVVIIINARV